MSLAIRLKCSAFRVRMGCLCSRAMPAIASLGDDILNSTSFAGAEQSCKLAQGPARGQSAYDFAEAFVFLFEGAQLIVGVFGHCDGLGTHASNPRNQSLIKTYSNLNFAKFSINKRLSCDFCGREIARPKHIVNC